MNFMGGVRLEYWGGKGDGCRVCLRVRRRFELGLSDRVRGILD